MAVKKKTKLLVVISLIIGAAVFVWMRFFRKDQFGGTMRLGPNGETIYNGKKVDGYLKTLKLENGFWTGSNGTNSYRWLGAGWEQID